MKDAIKRVLVYGTLTAVAAAAIFLEPPDGARGDLAAPSVAPVLVMAGRQQVDTLRRGETISVLLERAGIAGADLTHLLHAAASALDPRRAAPGLAITVRSAVVDSLPTEVIFRLAADHLLYLRRVAGTWTSEERRLPWTSDTVVVAGRIESTLYEALDSAAGGVLPPAQRAELAWAMADIYDYRIDMSRDLQPADSFRVLFVRQRGPGGLVRVGDILAARFSLSGTPIEAVRFASGGGNAEYFDQNGKSLRAAFLRAPLAFRRISSVFGRRKHPILGTWRSHKGTDYAANAGTPVRAIGDGVVIFAGRKGGYGNAIDIRHPNGYVSRYGHLRGFASGIHAGRHVSIGQTIAYVGMTGLATGPHLHFEILVHGVQRDPRVALRQTGGPPLAASDRARFDSVRTQLAAVLDHGTSGQQLAMR